MCCRCCFVAKCTGPCTIVVKWGGWQFAGSKRLAWLTAAWLRRLTWTPWAPRGPAAGTETWQERWALPSMSAQRWWKVDQSCAMTRSVLWPSGFVWVSGVCVWVCVSMCLCVHAYEGMHVREREGVFVCVCVCVCVCVLGNMLTPIWTTVPRQTWCKIFFLEVVICWWLHLKDHKWMLTNILKSEVWWVLYTVLSLLFALWVHFQHKASKFLFLYGLFCWEWMNCTFVLWHCLRWLSSWKMTILSKEQQSQFVYFYTTFPESGHIQLGHHLLWDGLQEAAHADGADPRADQPPKTRHHFPQRLWRARRPREPGGLAAPDAEPRPQPETQLQGRAGLSPPARRAAGGGGIQPEDGGGAQQPGGSDLPPRPDPSLQPEVLACHGRDLQHGPDQGQKCEVFGRAFLWTSIDVWGGCDEDTKKRRGGGGGGGGGDEEK